MRVEHSYDILGAGMLWKPKEARILTNFNECRMFWQGALPRKFTNFKVQNDECHYFAWLHYVCDVVLWSILLKVSCVVKNYVCPSITNIQVWTWKCCMSYPLDNLYNWGPLCIWPCTCYICPYSTNIMFVLESMRCHLH